MKRKWVLWTGALAAVVFLSGCAATQPPLAQQKPMIIKQPNGKYYIVPVGAVGKPLNSKEARALTKMTKGLLHCKSGYGLVASRSTAKKIDDLVRRYNSKLTPKELQKENRNPGLILKPNSREYREFLSFVRKKVQEGDLGCLPPMTSSQVRQYKAYVRQQQKLANDPRVVAARIQANAQMRAAYMQKQAIDNMAWQSMMNAMTPRTHNVFIY